MPSPSLQSRKEYMPTSHDALVGWYRKNLGDPLMRDLNYALGQDRKRAASRAQSAHQVPGRMCASMRACVFV